MDFFWTFFYEWDEFIRIIYRCYSKLKMEKYHLETWALFQTTGNGLLNLLQAAKIWHFLLLKTQEKVQGFEIIESFYRNSMPDFLSVMEFSLRTYIFSFKNNATHILNCISLQNIQTLMSKSKISKTIHTWSAQKCVVKKVIRRNVRFLARAIRRRL